MKNHCSLEVGISGSSTGISTPDRLDGPLEAVLLKFVPYRSVRSQLFQYPGTLLTSTRLMARMHPIMQQLGQIVSTSWIPHRTPETQVKPKTRRRVHRRTHYLVEPIRYS